MIGHENTKNLHHSITLYRKLSNILVHTKLFRHIFLCFSTSFLTLRHFSHHEALCSCQLSQGSPNFYLLRRAKLIHTLRVLNKWNGHSTSVTFQTLLLQYYMVCLFLFWCILFSDQSITTEVGPLMNRHSSITFWNWIKMGKINPKMSFLPCL